MKSFLFPLILISSAVATVSAQDQHFDEYTSHDLNPADTIRYYENIERPPPGPDSPVIVRGPDYTLKDGECLPLRERISSCDAPSMKVICDSGNKHKYCNLTNTDEIRPTRPCAGISMFWVGWSGKPGVNFDNWGGMMADELGDRLGWDDFAVSGLDYRNDVYYLEDIQKQTPTGYEDAADLLEEQLSKLVERCPKTKIVLGGRLHGCRIVRAALARPDGVAHSDKVKAGKSSLSIPS